MSYHPAGLAPEDKVLVRKEKVIEPSDETPAIQPPPIVLFDGVCNLCNTFVQWVIRRDHRARIRFASLQSEAARRALAGAGAPDTLPDGVVLIDRRGLHTRSTAALRVALALGFPHVLLSVFLVVPRFLRDGIYGWIASHRYRWFGKRDTCMVPTEEVSSRFLDAGPPSPSAGPAGAEVSSQP